MALLHFPIIFFIFYFLTILVFWFPVSLCVICHFPHMFSVVYSHLLPIFINELSCYHLPHHALLLLTPSLHTVFSQSLCLLHCWFLVCFLSFCCRPVFWHLLFIFCLKSFLSSSLCVSLHHLVLFNKLNNPARVKQKSSTYLL